MTNDHRPVRNVYVRELLNTLYAWRDVSEFYTWQDIPEVTPAEFKGQADAYQRVIDFILETAER